MLNFVLEGLVSRENLCADEHASLRDLIGLMQINQKGAVVIMKHGEPSGILTERDIVEILYRGYDLDESAEKFSKKKLITTKSDRTIGYSLNLMLGNNIRRVIVLHKGGEFAGIVTQQDLLKYLEEDFYRSTIKVKHIVDKLGYLISVGPDETLNNVLKVMVENKISAVAIVSDGMADGIITERDILRLAGERVSMTSRVAQYMTSPVINADLDTPLVDIVMIMNDKKVARVIILDKKGVAVNMVTTRDVVRNLDGDYSQFLERKLRNAKEILNFLPEMMIEILDTGSEQLIVWANEKVISTFGGRLIDKPVAAFLPRENWEKILSALKSLNKIENIKLKKDDRIYEISGFMLKTDIELEKGRIQLIMRDITADIKLSNTDALTGVYNRRFLNEFLMKEIERSKRMAKDFSLVICDIDNFKEINDTFGHLSGDMVLKSLTDLMTSTIRHFDVLSRYGGDEFMMIFPETAMDEVSVIVERLRNKIQTDDISLPDGLRAKITASFGLAEFPLDGICSDDLILKADERLYRAKSQGKNKVVAA